MTRYVFDTAQVSHIWAQGKQDSGRNSARRVFFEGRRIYSYGSHFLMGFLMPDGSAFLESRSYSVSTSGHQSNTRHAVKGRRLMVHNLESLADWLDSNMLAKPQYLTREGVAVDWPWDSEGRHISIGRANPPTRPATPVELKAARPSLLKLFLDAKQEAPADTVKAAFEYAGAKPEEQEKAAAKVAKTHAMRRAAEKAAALKSKQNRAADKAKRAAALSLADLKAKFKEKRENFKTYAGRYELESGLRNYQEQSKELFHAVKEAKRRGWTQVAAAASAKRKAVQAESKAFESFAYALWKKRAFGANVLALRYGLADLKAGAGGKPLAGLDVAIWRKRSGAAEELAAGFGGIEEAQGLGDNRRRAALMGADLESLIAGLLRAKNAFDIEEAKARAADSKAFKLQELETLRAWKAAGPEADKALANEAARVAGRYAEALGYRASSGNIIGAYKRPIPARYALAGFTGAAFRAILESTQGRLAAIRAAEAAAAALAEEQAKAAREAKAAAALADWRAGEGAAPYRATDSQGGALLRAIGVKRNEAGEITGGRLSTSWGAEAPLKEAIQVFRFLKLCRDKGKAWRANGRVLEVGSFSLDSVEPSGNFVAGCHRINWPEVAALAESLGLADLAAADTTRERALA